MSYNCKRSKEFKTGVQIFYVERYKLYVLIFYMRKFQTSKEKLFAKQFVDVF